jgi:hypothetical protein
MIRISGASLRTRALGVIAAATRGGATIRATAFPPAMIRRGTSQFWLGSMAGENMRCRSRGVSEATRQQTDRYPGWSHRVRPPAGPMINSDDKLRVIRDRPIPDYAWLHPATGRGHEFCCYPTHPLELSASARPLPCAFGPHPFSGPRCGCRDRAGRRWLVGLRGEDSGVFRRPIGRRADCLPRTYRSFGQQQRRKRPFAPR